MALSFNHEYHWHNGCPELNCLYPLWVNICLENAVKPQNNVPVWYVVLYGKPEAHRHILFILQNIERQDLIAIYFGPPEGLGSLRRLIHYYLKKKKK